MNKNAMNKKAFWLNVAVGVVWIGIGLRDLFAPHLFKIDGRVATNSTVILNFAVGVMFMLVAFSFHQASARELKSKS